jgi:predicted enzyme related to lactoylglutathione lyase
MIEGSPRQPGGAMMAGEGPATPARRMTMARLRHFAVCVKDLDKAAEFYANVFDLKRIGREDLDIGSAIYMSDGVINLALLNFKGKAGSKASDLEEGATFVGAHHFGFQVDDLAETEKRIEANGGKFFFDLGDERHGNFERKFKDPDGVIFDISKHGWQGTDGYKK